MYSTVSYGYLLVFYIAKGIKHHDIYLIQCCLIRLYVVLNLEGSCTSMLFLPLHYLKPLPAREMHYPFHM